MKKHVIASVAKQSLTIISATLLLTACGDDVTQINQTGLEVADSVKDLPKCTEKNEGDQAIVKGESFIRVCLEGEWFATTSGEDALAGEVSCSTKELKDGSGLKIICNGDSIGVVLNGSDGKDGKDADLPQDTLEADSERVPVSLDSLVGVTQKGPFLKGSTVYLYELSDGHTLKQTNGNFTSNITSNDGRYKFTARDLVSQYAMVVVDGYYRNEVTGNVSDAPIRLKAITDMRKRSSVNVNILTHLEFDRVYSLVTRGNSKGEKLTVKQAKKQAQKEILKVFGIELDKDTDAEDMDVFGKTDADAALLAISVLLQRDENATDLSVILTEISNALAENGEWNDSIAKAQLADWALQADTENRLAKFRRNVSDWHLGDTVPGFEKYVRNYVNVVSGLGSCGDKKNPVGSFAHVSNKNSKYYAQAYDSIDATKNSLTRLICDNEGGNHWRIATALERDTEGWTDDSAGAVRSGKIDTSRTYVYEDGWRNGTYLDRVVGFGCIKAIKDSVAKVSDDDWYKCDVTIKEDQSSWTAKWLSLNDYGKDMIYWETYKDSAAGTLVKGPLTGKFKVWDADTLRDASEYEVLLDKGCVTDMYGTSEVLPNSLKYSCSSSGWSKTGTFVAAMGGKSYKTYSAVQIGKQVWMAENLNLEYKVTTESGADSTYENFCLVNQYANCLKYGRIYTWAAAMDAKAVYSNDGKDCGVKSTCNARYPVQGVCPDGWHLPTKDEWMTLIDFVGDTTNAGNVLKQPSSWTGTANGEDIYGFSVLAGGYRYYDFWNGFSYFSEGQSTMFWTSTPYNETSSFTYAVSFASNTGHVTVYDDTNIIGLYVRCVKN